MGAAVDGLVQLLDLEQIEVDVFRGRSPKEDRQRVFGGQVAGQALVAAGRTVERGSVHSLHAYFLRAGDPTVPILYQVDRIRDGRSFTTRRVVAVQRGKAIFHLSASFQRDETGPTHQRPMPEVPPPESLPTFEERMGDAMHDLPGGMQEWLERERPIETRAVQWSNPFKPVPRPPRQQVWIRAAAPLPDEPPLLHQCVVVYASDITLLDNVALPHAIAWASTDYMMASLDHAMWFHRPFRADQWLLYDQESPVAYGARGLCMGHLFQRDGTLVVSVVQEGLVRPITKPRPA